MAENRHIEELDTFAKKYVKEIPQEEPSIGFTVSIMENILKESNKNVFTPKELITKKGWFLIVSFLLVILFVASKQIKESTIKVPKFDFSFLNKIQIPNLFESFSISNTVLYAVFFLGLMIMAQVVFLKGYFEKRI